MNLSVSIKGTGNISDAAHKDLYKSLLPEVREYEEYLINRAVDAFKSIGWKEKITVIRKGKKKFSLETLTKDPGNIFQPFGDFVTFKESRDPRKKKGEKKIPKKRKLKLQ